MALIASDCCQVGYKAVKNAFRSGGFIGLVKGKEWNAVRRQACAFLMHNPCPPYA